MIYSPKGADDIHRTSRGDDMPRYAAWINKNRTFVGRQMFCFCWRREWDSNPRACRQTVFKTASLWPLRYPSVNMMHSVHHIYGAWRDVARRALLVESASHTTSADRQACLSVEGCRYLRRRRNNPPWCNCTYLLDLPNKSQTIFYHKDCDLSRVLFKSFLVELQTSNPSIFSLFIFF